MISRILLPMVPDQDLTWSKALPVAASLASSYGAQLHLLTVVPRIDFAVVISQLPENHIEEAMNNAKEALDTFTKDHVASNITCSGHVVYGKIWEEIVVAAKDHKTDLIVMASHKPNFSDHFLASNADRVLRHCPNSVLVVR